MKTLALSVLVLVCAFGGASLSHAKITSTTGNILLASTNCADTIRDNTGTKLGAIEADGTVTDNTGTKLGAIEAGGTVTDNTGTKLGAIETGGTVNTGFSISQVRGKEGVLFFFFNFFRVH